MDNDVQLTGYFTVEATMVLPIVFCAIYFTLCFLFFRYDRCLMEQDVGVLLLRGSTGQYPATSFATKMQEQAASLPKDKYVLWEDEGYHIELRSDNVSVEGNGWLGIQPIGSFLGGDEIFTYQTKQESRRMNPTLFIRSYNKIRED